MKQIRILLAVCLLVVTTTTTVSAAEQPLQKEYTFTSETANFSYPAKKKLKEFEDLCGNGGQNGRMSAA